MPKHVGTWVLGIMDGELIKWGKESDTQFPFPPDDKEAIEQAKYLAINQEHDTIYILHVFDNGQMKQFEFDLSEYADE